MRYALLFLILPFFGTSQIETDNAKQIAYMQECLRKGQKQFKTGMFPMVLGAGLTTYGTFAESKDVMVVGGLITLVGLFWIGDSYKWIGRAGTVAPSATGVGMVYRFK